MRPSHRLIATHGGVPNTMSRKQFEQLARRFESCARQHPAQYKLKIALAAALGYASMLVVPGVILAIGAAFSVPALAQKAGGILKRANDENPPSASIHEEGSNIVTTPFVPIFNNLVIIEAKMGNGKKQSSIVRAMKKFHIAEKSISKYCLGVSLLVPHIKKNNFKPAVLFLEKLLSDKTLTNSFHTPISNS